MSFRRGFKQDCERVATEVREELRLRLDEPIDMSRLASILEIPVHALATYVRAAGLPHGPDVDEIYEKVAAFTTYRGPHRTIVYNDRHALPRHRSNLAHELAHALLHHPPRSEQLSPKDEAAHEQEAGWMGGVLMLTRSQALHLARLRTPAPIILQQFEISQQMLRFRMNVTGAARLA